MLAAGLVFSFSIFVEPIEADMGFSRSETSLIFPVSLSVSILGQIIAGIFAKKNLIRYNFILTAVLSGFGFYLAGTIQSIGTLLLSYGILVGLAIGMMYNGVLSTVVLHFEEKADFIAGLLLMSFALGSMALGTLSAGLIERIGWRETFWVFSIVFAVLSIVGVMIVRRPALVKEEQVVSDYGKQQIPPGVMVRKKQYILTFIWITVLVSTYLVISGHAALCLYDIGASPYVAAFSIGLIAVANVVARVVISAVFKYLGSVKMQYLLTLIGGVSSAICLVGYLIGLVPAMLIGYGMLGFLNGGCTIVINSYIMNEFGNQNFGMNMAITNIHLAIASFFGPAIAGFLKAGSGDYKSTFVVMISFGIISFFVLRVNKKSV